MRVVELRVASCSCELRVASCELRVASCELRVASCELRVASCELKVRDRKDVEKYIGDWGKSLINMGNSRGPNIDP